MFVDIIKVFISAGSGGYRGGSPTAVQA